MERLSVNNKGENMTKTKYKYTLTQFKAILKKDLTLLFRKKVALFIFGGPFIIMFAMFAIPYLFSGQHALSLVVYSADEGAFGKNIGSAIVGNLSDYYASNSNNEITVEVAYNYNDVLNTTDMGLFIPNNFTYLAFTSIPQLFIVDNEGNMLAQTQLSVINNIAQRVMVSMIANRTIPSIENVQISSSNVSPETSLSSKAILAAYPLGYMIFLLVTLNSSSNSIIGFAREKRMRTMEILLSYTQEHYILIISKVITGLVASLGSAFSYILGILSATILFSPEEGSNMFDIFSVKLKVFTFWDMLIIFFAVVISLIISTLMTMAVDCNITKEASERLSPLISIGFSFFFYFVVIVHPYRFSLFLLFDPFYWPYRATLLLLSGQFNIELLIEAMLTTVLFIALIALATKGVQKEKTLYLD